MEIDPAFYDAELRLHNEHLRAAADVQPSDRVLDIGCGTGLTTREAARAAVDGNVLGVDVSAPMLEWARRLSDEEGLDNIAYEEADAQTYPFPPEHFDLCISRCGTMFFADPVAAFTNIGHALRPRASRAPGLAGLRAQRVGHCDSRGPHRRRPTPPSPTTGSIRSLSQTRRSPEAS